MGSSDYEIAFLTKVLKEEKGNLKSDRNLLIIAVHAVFLESGFIPFNSITNKKVDGFQNIYDEWALESIYFQQDYIARDLLVPDANYGLKPIVSHFVTSCEEYLNVFLEGPDPHFFVLCLGKSLFVPSLKFLCLNNDEENGSSFSSKDFKYHERRVLEFWKITKDNLVLPLQIRLCEKSGMALPPCFMGLLTDLKLKILGFLPGADIAKMACVSSELRYLCSNSELLRLKVKKGFEKLPAAEKKLHSLRRIQDIYGGSEESYERLLRVARTYRSYCFFRNQIVKGD